MAQNTIRLGSGEASFELSTTVQHVVRELGKRTAVTAIEFAVKILGPHRFDYVPPFGEMVFETLVQSDKSVLETSQNYKYVNNPVERPVDEWLNMIGQLYSPKMVEKIHGKLVLLALALLDGSPRRIF